MFFEGNVSKPIITNIDSIVSYSYKSFVIDESRLPDTIIVNNQDSFPLYMDKKEIESFPEHGHTISESFSFEGELESTTKIVQDEKGRMKENTVSYADATLAEYMNSTKLYNYKNGNLSSISDGGLDVLSLEYDSDALPVAMSMNAGFAMLRCDREKTTEGYKYNMDIVPIEGDDGLGGLMAGKMNDMPKAYALYTKQNDNHHFTFIEENSETGEIESEETVIRNMKGQVIESKKSKGLSSHKKFKYNQKGEVIEIEDLIKEETLINEVDKNGNIIKRHEEYEYYVMIYDENNVLTEERTYNSFGDNDLKSLVIKKVYYK